jgi:hypothetical protein
VAVESVEVGNITCTGSSTEFGELEVGEAIKGELAVGCGRVGVEFGKDG